MIMFVTEVFAQKKLFKDIFKESFPDDYKTIFGEINPDVLDGVVNLKYGGKTVLSKITPDNVEQVCTNVITLNVSQWVQAAKVMQTEYNVLKPVRRSTLITETGTEKQTSNDSNTTAIKAFNDTEFSPDNKNDSNSDKNVTTNHEHSETVTGFDGDVTDKLKKDFAFRLDNWRNSIIFALINEITIDIY